MTKDDRWITVAEAAAYTRMSEAWVKARVAEGSLRPVAGADRRSRSGTGPRAWVLDVRDVDALMERLKTNMAAPAAEATTPREVPRVLSGPPRGRDRLKALRREG